MARHSTATDARHANRTDGADRLDRRLATLKRPQLEALTHGLAADHPDWLPAIEKQLGEVGNLLEDSRRTAMPRARRPGPDTARLRRELRSIWRSLGPS